MLHHRECLPFLLESHQNGFGVHAGLDQFDRHFTFHRLDLFRNPDFSHAAFADLLQ